MYRIAIPTTTWQKIHWPRSAPRLQQSPPTQHHQAETPASVAYEILPDRIALRLDDTSGWLARTQDAPGETWTEALAAAGFDAVELDADGCTLRLVRRFAPGAGEHDEP